MHGLPSDFDPVIFVGRQLESVTFAVNAIRLAFDGDMAITALSEVRYRTTSKADVRIDVTPVADSGLMALLGSHVVDAETRPPGDLTLLLEAGGSVMVFDDSKEFECYSVTTPEGEIFV